MTMAGESNAYTGGPGEPGGPMGGPDGPMMGGPSGPGGPGGPDAPMVGGPDAPMAQPSGGPVGGPPPGNDSVTGVLNMAAFGQSFARLSANPPERAALWYVDIRMFRSINPKYGYLQGNMVLNTVAECVDSRLAHGLPITRLGGDRFVFLSAGIDLDEADAAFHEMVEDVNATIAENGVNTRISLLGGFYYLRDTDYQSHDFKRALDYASIAHRKAQSDPYSKLVPFTDEDLERDMRRIVIEQTIDQALVEGQIEVWYQPQIDYTFGEVVGAEALARWNHPELGWISPVEFIPVLEECGKVHELDLFVWEEACRNAGRWRSAADGKPVPISVNVSRAEMFESDLLEHFQELKEKYSLPHGSLHLEVTESAFVEEADRLYRIIEKMRAHDMVIEMDDFGSGLSSLNMLKDVPVDVVKLDMGFVRSGVNEDRGGVVLGSIIRMLQGLDTPIIAEGVETLEQAEMLKNMGCHLMQGFHFSHPMPLEEFERFANTNATVERTERKQRTDSHLEELLSFDKDSSYLFNEAIGGMMFFFVQGDKSESILVNDKFYEECGLKRSDFGNRKIDPIQEIDEELRTTLWNAAAEAREFGSAMCIGKVRMTGRWFQACMRYLGENTRGRIFSLDICRSGKIVEREEEAFENFRKHGWTLAVLDKIVPNGFVKCKLDEDLTVDFASTQLVESLGHSGEEFIRRFHHSFLEIVSVSTRSAFVDAVNTAMQTGELVDCEIGLYNEAGDILQANVIGNIAEDVTGERLLYLLVLIKGEEEGVKKRDDRVILFDYSMLDDKLVVHARNADGSPREIVLTDWTKTLEDLPDMIDPPSAAKVIATVRDLRHHPLTGFTDLKCNLRGSEGLRWYHVNYNCDADEDGNTTVVHGYAQDANDEMGSVKWWKHQAETCQLTGLLNRSAAEQNINLLMHRHRGGMMLMIDLDGFKRVNDELGHMVGDELLREVADTLADCFRETDVLGRYGGDEFVAFMPAPATGDARELALNRAEKIIGAIKQIQIPDGTHAGCSVGIALCEGREASFYDLLEVADQALYDSKANGKGKATLYTM